MIVTKTIDLDMSRRLVNDTIRLHEGDVNGTVLALNVTDNGTPFDLTGCTAKFDAVIGKYLAEADGVATISGSTITVPITPQMTVINGLLKIDVKIIKGGSILFFQTLEMNVQSRVIQGDEQIDLDGTTIGQKLELLDELFENPPEQRLEIYDNDLDSADRNDTVYIHKVHSGTGSYVKGIVFVAGDVPPYQGCTQYRLRKSGSVEYRTGALNTTTDPYSYDWNYTATGNWKRLATLDDIPDIPEVVNPWKNKTYISHGDSITWQDGRAYGSGTHQGETARGYQTVLRELLELGTHTNKGVNGATLADRAGVSVSGVSTIKSIASYASYDLCTIAFGTNDFKQGVPLGTLGAATDTVFNTTTFFGAFREAIRYILTSSPTIRLVLMTPLQRDQHDFNVDTVNAVGLKLIDYVNAVKLIGKMYGLPVCDLYSNSGITELTLSTYTIDGLHPNDEGYKRMGEVLANTLTSGGNNDAADLSEYVKEDDVYSIGEADETFAKLTPIDPTAEQIETLPNGQLYGDTVNHKGTVKGGQSFYDTDYIDNALREKQKRIFDSGILVGCSYDANLYSVGDYYYDNTTLYRLQRVRIIPGYSGQQPIYEYYWRRSPTIFGEYGGRYPSPPEREDPATLGTGMFSPPNYHSGDFIQNSSGIYLCTGSMIMRDPVMNYRPYYSYNWEKVAYTKTEIDSMIGNIESLLSQV